VDANLQATPIQKRLIVLTAFAEWVRSGACGRGKKVRAPTVQVALRALGQTFELAGEPNPIYRSEQRYFKAIERQIEGFRREDPPPKPKLAVPPTVPAWLHHRGQASTQQKYVTIGALGLIAFYYLLRVGEYTTKDARQNGRTVQFRVQDITFRRQGNIIPNTAGMKALSTADEATMHISNQKNGTRGQLVHHEGFEGPDCPVKALTRQVGHIMQHTNDQSNIISTYFDDQGYKHFVNSNDMNTAVKEAVTHLGLSKQGITADLVGSHSLRAGSAMAAKLNGVDRDTIRKMGRWSSDTFLMYIHEQIAHLSAGVAKKMSRRVPFRNIAGIATVIDPPTVTP
jgi:hypothetical protein